MTDQQIKRQIQIIEEGTEELLKDKEAALKFLEESDILKILFEMDEYWEEKNKIYSALSSAI